MILSRKWNQYWAGDTIRFGLVNSGFVWR